MGDKKSLTVGLVNEIDDLDPRNPQEFAALQVLLQVFETPYSLPLEGRSSRPQLFSSPLQRIEDGEDGMAFAASVRSGVEFSDGTALTAERMVASYEGALPEGVSAEARDGEVVFTLDNPNPRFHHQLIQAPYAVVLEKGGALLGTGPFVHDPTSTAEEIRLTRNERYRDEVPLDEIVFRVYPVDEDGRPTALLEAIQSGEVDLCSVLGREDLAELTMVRKFILPGASTTLLYFNTDREVLGDPRMRKALALAVDRRELTKICYANSFAFVASGPLPPFMERAHDDLDPDPEGAEELLSELDLPDRLELMRVWGPRPYLPKPVEVSEALGERFRELGIELEITAARDPDDYFRRVSRGDADLFLSGWAAETTDPSVYLDAILSSRWIPRPGNVTSRANLARYESEAMDAALDRYRSGARDDTSEILEILSEEVPFLPVMYGAAVYVHSFRVRSFTPSPLGWTVLGDVDLAD
ncbi:MAG: ABC transporter substrate-binding protein [Thermoanaerobaculia bacterium]|nr:ABC transporter substrate-binding protein [Thermoanaerobaculia bacterium]